MNMRLAYRTEGVWWIAYLARADTMDGAVEVGRIRRAPALACDKVHDGFLALGRMVLAAAFGDVNGLEIDRWDDPVAAPESERAGHA